MRQHKLVCCFSSSGSSNVLFCPRFSLVGAKHAVTGILGAVIASAIIPCLFHACELLMRSIRKQMNPFLGSLTVIELSKKNEKFPAKQPC